MPIQKKPDVKEELIMRKRYALVSLLVLVTAFAAGSSGVTTGAQDTCLTIGMVLGGAKDDAGYNQSHYDALMQVKENIPCVQTIVVEYISDAEAESVMETMIQQGAKLIFPAGFPFQYPAIAVAERHPDVVFMHPGGWEVRPNFSNYFAKTQQAFFLMGVAAGMMTETNKLGFVAGMPLGFTLGNVNGFHLGARAVNPDVQTHLVYTFSWGDTTKEAAAAQALLDQGADVVTMHLDSPIAVIQTIEAAGAYTIGFMSKGAQQFAPNGWITGLLMTWGDYYTQAAQQVIDGTWHTGFVREGLAAGFMEIADFGPAVPENVKQFVLTLAEGFKTDLLNPFTGPIRDQDGNTRIAEGEAWGNEKMGDFDWLVEGIIGEPQ